MGRPGLPKPGAPGSGIEGPHFPKPTVGDKITGAILDKIVSSLTGIGGLIANNRSKIGATALLHCTKLNDDDEIVRLNQVINFAVNNALDRTVGPGPATSVPPYLP